MGTERFNTERGAFRQLTREVDILGSFPTLNSMLDGAARKLARD